MAGSTLLVVESAEESDRRADPAQHQAAWDAVHAGLGSSPKTLPPWLFYDKAGSALFERITELPEYYPTRTERSILARYASPILDRMRAPVAFVELGAGTATKTGLLLAEALRRQGHALYQPIDVSASALEEARNHLTRDLPGVEVSPLVANYVSESFMLERPRGASLLGLYIGSSIGNFAPHEAHAILCGLRRQMRTGDALLLGTDLAPGEHKPVERLVAAYDDAEGVTAAFNRNVLTRLNRDLGMNFDPRNFAHEACWNASESRIEMHLRATRDAQILLPPLDSETQNSNATTLEYRIRAGESIHTENSYKFSRASVSKLVEDAGFTVEEFMTDEEALFGVTLARVP